MTGDDSSLGEGLAVAVLQEQPLFQGMITAAIGILASRHQPLAFSFWQQVVP